MDALNSIELTLKTPNQRVNDIRLKCGEDWTIRNLKEHLQDVYPSKPEWHSQKLIYLGKLLQDDHALLKEVFSTCAKTLHIVCHETQMAETQPGPSQTITVNEDSSSTETDGVRYRGTHQAQASFIPTVTQPQHPMMTNSNSHLTNQQTTNQLNPQQQYQMHMQQYYMQMQQWQFAMATGQWPYQNNFQHPSQPSSPLTSPTAPSSPPITPQQPQVQDPVQDQPQIAAAAPQQRPANQNVPMNAGPGGAMIQDEDENGQNRDWLDWLYMSMRGLMLMSIIYFYSSTSRFFLVAILGLIVYLYQAGMLNMRRPEQQQQQQQQEPVQDNLPDHPDGVPPTEGDEQQNTENSENEQSSEVPSEAPSPPGPGVLKLFCTCVVTFFTSMIPATPPPLQQN